MYTIIIERNFTFMPAMGKDVETDALVEIHLTTGKIATSWKLHMCSDSRRRVLHPKGMVFRRGMAGGT